MGTLCCDPVRRENPNASNTLICNVQAQCGSPSATCPHSQTLTQLSGMALSFSETYLPINLQCHADCLMPGRSAEFWKAQGIFGMPWVLCSFVEQYFVEGPGSQPAAKTAPVQSSSGAGDQGPPTQAFSLDSSSATKFASEGPEQDLQSSRPHSNGIKSHTVQEHSLRQAEPDQASNTEASTLPALLRSSPSGQHAASAAAGAAGTPIRMDSSEGLLCKGPARLACIWVYPIKSCAGFAPSSWPLGLNGLLYDRYRQTFCFCSLYQA